MTEPAGISPAAIWTVIAGLGVLTYAIRFSFLGLLGGRPVGPRLRRVLGFVPATVLPALIAPMVLSDGAGGIAVEPDVGIASAAALAAAYLTGSNIAGIAAGTAGFALARLLL